MLVQVEKPDLMAGFEYTSIYKIESLNLGGGVLIVRKCEALLIICLRIQHEMESNMG